MGVGACCFVGGGGTRKCDFFTLIMFLVGGLLGAPGICGGGAVVRAPDPLCYTLACTHLETLSFIHSCPHECNEYTRTITIIVKRMKPKLVGK